MTSGKDRNPITLRAKFALLPLLAAIVAVALWSPPPPPAQAQANCGSGPLNGRTQAVVNAILSKLGESDCSAVTNTQLADITGTLDLESQGLTSLQEGDFAGLSGLQTLDLVDNSLRGTLPEDLFDGLSDLEVLQLSQNGISSLPEDLFDGLSSLEKVTINNNLIKALPEDLFDGLSSLQKIYMNNIDINFLPEDLFDGLSSLRELYAYSLGLNCIHASQFSGLSELRILQMSATGLGNIAPAHFVPWGLDKLEELETGDNSLSGSGIDFQQYKDVLPALVESRFEVRSGAGLSSPICGSIEADADGSGFHTTVRVQLEENMVRPNRVRESDASLLGDGFCGSNASETQHILWTWQRSADKLTWTDVARQPPDYGTRTEGQCSYIYTPHADDNTMYVRAYVSVSTSGLGNKDYRSAIFGPLNVRQP